MTAMTNDAIETDAVPARTPAPDPDPTPTPTLDRVAVIVPVCERHDDLVGLARDFAPQVAARAAQWEFLFVLDGPRPALRDDLAALCREDARFRVVHTHRSFGEATLAMAGLGFTEARTLVLLAPYYQIQPDGLGALLDRFVADGLDVASAARNPRVDSAGQQTQTRLFHRVIERVSGVVLTDVACGVKVVRREVLEDLNIYGDQYRFLPLLAIQRGFRIGEIPVPQSPRDVRPKVYQPGIYVRRALDLLSVIFLFKFTEKPLRFFGLMGLGCGGVGAAIIAYLGIYRILGMGDLANRPLLVLGALLFVMGAQAVAIGLLGELMIYSHSRGTDAPLMEEVVAGKDDR